MTGTFLLLFLILGGGISTALAAFEDRGPVPSSDGSGGLHAADAGSFTARTINPSSGSWRSAWGFHAAWSDPFGIPELSQIRVDVNGPILGTWTLGGWGMGLGGAAYSERSVGLTLSRRFGATFAAGLGISHSSVELDHYGSDHLLALDAGLIYRLRLFDLGLAIDNLASGEMQRLGDDPLQRLISAGISLPVDDGSRLLFDYRWDENGEGAVRGGLELRLYGPIRFRAGWDGWTERLSVGFGIGVGGWSADSAWDHHPYLGWSTGAGLRWEPDDEPRP